MRIVYSKLWICFLLAGGKAFGQIDPGESRNHVILKWSPLCLFDIDNTVQLGLEVPFGKSRFTAQQDIGYGRAGFNIWYANQETKPDKNTIKARTQFRYYFYQRPSMRAYVAGEYLFKRVVTSDMRLVGRECSGGCAFFENMRVSQGRFVNAVHVKAGWQFYFTNRTTMDVFTGFGLRQARVRTLTPGVTQNFNLDTIWDFWRSNGNGVHEVIPSLAVGFHIGFALGKFKKPVEGL